MKQDEFDRYLENLAQESKKYVCFGSIYDKALFQGAMMGILVCDKEHTFTGKQVAKIIETVLDYKSPGNEGSTGHMMAKSHSIAARAARNYKKEEERKYEALRDYWGNFITADDGRGLRTGSEDDPGHNGRTGF